MDLVDWKPEIPGGGRATAGGGGFYHVSFRSGSRASGSCASAAHDYITRSGEYDDQERDALIYTESDNLPSWAEDDAREYWDAADLYERANGRLYVSADFALPRDLDPKDQADLAHAFAEELTADEHLPYTLAIHAGWDAGGQEHNPHAHLMISERQNDGITRSREQWFRRANSVHPERGGAPKSRTFHGRDWLEHARERWAALTNERLERAGRHERVDHRSYERQGVDRDPSQHFGPAAAHIVGRAEAHDRLETAAAVATDQDRLLAVERAIAELEAAREMLGRNAMERADGGRAESDVGSCGQGQSRDDDAYHGR